MLVVSIEREQRKNLREELLNSGINPYPHVPKYKPVSVSEVVSNPNLGTYVSVAGRVVSFRKHGKLIFLDLVDDGVRIQCSINARGVGEDKFNQFARMIDLGDFINVHGKLYRTRKGELTVDIADYQLLSKALRSPPVKWGHRLLDPEVRYRKRYLDIMMTPEVREILRIRFKTVEEVRKFMWSKGYIEVETPILQPVYGGAEARPFKTHIRALNEDWYLRISLELYLKRLIVAGFNKVFEIGKNFRNEDIDVLHNPEFTMMESYEAYADYNNIMRLTEELISTVSRKVIGSTTIQYPAEDGEKLDLSPPYRRVSLIDGLKEFINIDVESLNDIEIKELLRKNQISLPGGYNRGRAIVKLFDKLVGREYLFQPTFVVDFPKESSPLTKPHRERKDLAERFELYIGGFELANAYTELNDPVLQEMYFREEEKRRQMGDLEAHPFDWDFIEALEYGMPPTGGLGVGIDRLVLVLSGQTSIKEVIPFPMLKKTSTE